MNVPHCRQAFLTTCLLLHLVLYNIPTSHSSPSVETAEINVDHIPLDSQIVNPLRQEGARQETTVSGTGDGARFSDPNLHPEHYRYYFNRRPDEAEACRLDPTCPYKESLDTSACWGYEKGCTPDRMSGYPKAYTFQRKWFHSEQAQVKQFWIDNDFGYIKKILDDGWYAMCTPKTQNGSSLSCVDNAHSCVAKNLWLSLPDFQDHTKHRGRLDPQHFGSPGNVGGHCNLNKELLKKHSKHLSELQSWYGELREFTSLKSDPFMTSSCDVVIEGRAYLMKLDAGINLFHHFCDFVNLYITQHLMNDFSLNSTIVMWDMSNMRYIDLFQDTWAAFSNRPIARLNDWSGKKVCFRDAVCALPPRMIRGFFYNMPVIPDTYGSSLMRSFSQHVLHRLGIQQKGPLKTGKVRVTILDRKAAHRNIVNQKELVEALREDPSYEVQVVVYNHSLTFLQQIEITHNSDIFIGMHGAGLTHLLFLPDWAAIFEVCNCEDKHCYEDLANLRGVHYMTWENYSLLKKQNEVLHPSLKKPHPKFCDYFFDKDEFVRLVKKAHLHVSSHDRFQREVALRDEL
ncbi:EGF domain-specific O-linked N-acetylglucosamine transferase-like [Patiria miniata]|uniref:EGF domain-specific O-linked N-acetylglucosamine transferase n=1 Tax=Patiria miniata TaxID=46514 RepID=A0A913ZSI4_PATMI|nr:EGF domain-specific O-linked N-acetylglucosamine transferase-like [Patiria miniata]XP_038054364.1 EGF domain-specific O-linked N-acetylglucosamine transferase-like [Patiria miniata]